MLQRRDAREFRQWIKLMKMKNFKFLSNAAAREEKILVTVREKLRDELVANWMKFSLNSRAFWFHRHDIIHALAPRQINGNISTKVDARIHYNE